MQPPDSGNPVVRDTRLVARYPGKSKFLLHYVNMLENTHRWESISLFSPDPEGMWQDFLQLFDLRELAGGVIRDDRDRVFFIGNNKEWHLPTKPVARDSDPVQTALALAKKYLEPGSISIDTELPATFHVQREDGQRILYKTSWFRFPTVQPAAVTTTVAGQWMEQQEYPHAIPARIMAIFRK